jgi:hypothetical protein
MKKGISHDLRGDALTARAVELEIALDEFREPGGSIKEIELRRRIRKVERYSADIRIDLVFLGCVVAFAICGFAAWAAVRWLGRP